MRGYGLGTAIIILTMGLIWRFIEKPGLLRGLSRWWRVLSVQSLYQNAFFLFAICVGGMVVCLRQRRAPPRSGCSASVSSRRLRSCPTSISSASRRAVCGEPAAREPVRRSP